MGNEWDDYAEGWDSDPSARAYADAAFDSLVELLESVDSALEGASVLDFGCGTGLLTEKMVTGGATVFAVDTSPAMLDVVRAKVVERGWATVRLSDTVPGDEKTFDLVVCSSVCAFVDDYPATVAQLVTCLRPGGAFVQWDWERTGDDEFGLSRQEISAVLAGAGLDGITVRPAFSVDVEGHTMSPLVGSGLRPV